MEKASDARCTCPAARSIARNATTRQSGISKPATNTTTGESPDKRELLELIDILVDGRYIKELHDSLLQFRGSSNQRIIDVPKSLESGQVVIWPKLHDQTRFIPEIYGKDRSAGEGSASWVCDLDIRRASRYIIRHVDWISCLICALCRAFYADCEHLQST